MHTIEVKYGNDNATIVINHNADWSGTAVVRITVRSDSRLDPSTFRPREWNVNAMRLACGDLRSADLLDVDGEPVCAEYACRAVCAAARARIYLNLISFIEDQL